VGTAAEFLGLSREEEALIAMRLALSDALKRERRKKRLSQKQLADRLQSSQSRVAKMDAGDPGVTLDLLIQALLVAGATRAQSNTGSGGSAGDDDIPGTRSDWHGAATNSPHSR
jgi:transcriptional regulator with XRE-family HTH domain